MKLALHIRGHGAVRARGRVYTSDCEFRFARGKPIALAPAAVPGWMFAGWAGYCDGADLCRVDTVLRHAVTARFVPVPVRHFTPAPEPVAPRPVEHTHTVHVALTTSITGDPAARLQVRGRGSCAHRCSFARGAKARLRVVHDRDATVRWAGAACSGDTCKVRMRRDRTVRATIVELPRTATWTGSACDTDDCSPATVTAPLQVQPRTLDAGSDGNGVVVVGDTPCAGPARCARQYGYGTPLTLTAVPADGFEFAGWDGCPEAVGDTCHLRLTNDRTITAHFREPVPVETGPA